MLGVGCVEQQRGRPLIVHACNQLQIGRARELVLKSLSVSLSRAHLRQLSAARRGVPVEVGCACDDVVIDGIYRASFEVVFEVLLVVIALVDDNPYISVHVLAAARRFVFSLGGTCFTTGILQV